MVKTSISFYTLGCRLNQSETAVVTNLFENSGFRIVNPGEPSDITVINTCTVTHNSDTDTRKLVNRIVRENPLTDIALIGCQAQTQKESLLKLPNIRWVVGTEKKMDLVSILNSENKSISPQVIVPRISRKSFTIPTAGIDRHHTRANIKIQDGCDDFCTFCEIPFARGRARSREFDDIIKEARALTEAGHQEIILTGINIGTYHYREHDMADVIDALENIPQLKRIRISSIEPTTVVEKLLNKMAQKSKLCRYLHIPIQSANSPILQLMQRRYNAEDIMTFIEKAKQRVENICIGTDIIVGFPGESDRHFDETYDRLKESSIHYFHVFSYSERTLSRSRQFKDKVPVPIIQKRSLALRELSHTKRMDYYTSMLGKDHDVLFEQKKEGAWRGLTDNYIHVQVKTEDYLQNQIKKVRLEQIADNTVVGKMVT